MNRLRTEPRRGVAAGGLRIAALCVSLVTAALVATAGPAAGETARPGANNIRMSLQSVNLATRYLKPGAFDKTRLFAGSWNMLSLSGTNLADTGVSVAAAGWALGPLSQAAASGSKGDLVYGRVSWQDPTQRVHLRAGRIGVFAGAPRYVFMDGAAATVWLPGSIRADAYYGTAVRQNFRDAFSAPVVGGRLAWSNWKIGHLGVAYQDVSEQAATPRRTVGLDFSIRALESVQITGLWAHDLLGGGLQRARVDALWHATRYLDLFTRAEVRDPLAWVPKYSIFNAFIARTDNQVGGGFDLRTPGALEVLGRYDRYINDGAPDGYQAEGELRLHVDKRGRHLMGLIAGSTYNGNNGYWHARIYGRTRPTPRLTLSIDLDGYRFFREIHAYDKSMLAAVAARWKLLDGLHVTLDGRTWQSPYFKQEAMLMFQVQVDQTAFERLLGAGDTAAAPAATKPAATKPAATDSAGTPAAPTAAGGKG